MVALHDLLKFQLQNAQDLLVLLEEEKCAITQRVSSDIEAVAHKKIALIEQLNTTDQRIAKHSEVACLIDDINLKTLVDEISSTISTCQQENEINGQALERAQISFHKLKNLMQQSQGKIGMTYSADGKTKSISTLGTDLKA